MKDVVRERFKQDAIIPSVQDFYKAREKLIEQEKLQRSG